MARVEVFPFKRFKSSLGKVVLHTRLATREYIEACRGELILGKMRKVEDTLLDREGQLVLDPTGTSAKFLKELDAEGEADAPSGLNRKAMDALVAAGLVKATLVGARRTRYKMRECGRQYVRDLLS